MNVNVKHQRVVVTIDRHRETYRESKRDRYTHRVYLPTDFWQVYGSRLQVKVRMRVMVSKVEQSVAFMVTWSL